MLRQLLLSMERLLPGGVRRIGERLYRSLPPSIRYGRAYVDAVGFLEQSQWWPREKLDAWQLAELRKLVRHAYDHSPFYRRLYDSHGVGPDDLQELDDLRRFPTVCKDDLRAAAEEIRVTDFARSKFQYHTTGGSTGKPVGLYWEADRTVPLERAFMHRQFGWVGFRLDVDRSVALRGIPVRGGESYEELPGRQIRFSSYDMTPENLDQYVEIIDRYRPVAIMAYPSSAHILAQHLFARGGHRFEGLKVVLCGSENIYPWQRELIASAFGCRAYSWYGQSEYVALGGECEHSTDYHFYSEYGVTEIIREDGGVAAPGDSGEIVATGFNNRAFPLIRYRTEDIARRSTRTTCECGRSYLLVETVEGRLQEMIVAKGGNLISMTAINMHSDVFDNVRQFQFYQDAPGRLTFRVVRRSTYTPDDERRIRAALAEKLRDQFDLEIVYVESIALTPRGKATFLEQKLPVATLSPRR
jgi:phenylacetate-CoA ligase